ncbi:hypothetical protein C7212DRAFT_156669, partial [Tuber magnatum]
NRFSREEIERLVNCLDIPPRIYTENGIFEPDSIAFCMLLARLAWSHQLSDIHLQFGWKPESISQITNALLKFIYEQWKHLLSFDMERITPQCLAAYTIAIKERNAPLNSCWDFVDETLRPIARPIYGQESLYNGWKRMHCLKYQTVIAPDGIIIQLYGPVEGQIHDSTVWTESGVSEILNAHAYAPDGSPLQVYGDRAYGISDYLISLFCGTGITANERDWNKAMSRVRIVVKWCSKEVLQLFTALDFKQTQRLLVSPLGLQYSVAVLLYNAHVCLHNPQILQYFSQETERLFNLSNLNNNPVLLQPPTLEEYYYFEE